MIPIISISLGTMSVSKIHNSFGGLRMLLRGQFNNFSLNETVVVVCRGLKLAETWVPAAERERVLQARGGGAVELG